MNIYCHFKNMKAVDELRQYAEERIKEKVFSLCHKNSWVQVTFEHSAEQCIVRMDCFYGHGRQMYSSAKGADFHQVLESCMAKLATQIHKRHEVEHNQKNKDSIRTMSSIDAAVALNGDSLKFESLDNITMP